MINKCETDEIISKIIYQGKASNVEVVLKDGTSKGWSFENNKYGLTILLLSPLKRKKDIPVQWAILFSPVSQMFSDDVVARILIDGKVVHDSDK